MLVLQPRISTTNLSGWEGLAVGVAVKVKVAVGVKGKVDVNVLVNEMVGVNVVVGVNVEVAVGVSVGETEADLVYVGEVIMIVAVEVADGMYGGVGERIAGRGDGGKVGIVS